MVLKKIKRYIITLILFLCLILVLILGLSILQRTKASTKLEGINNFPASYQPYLREIAKNHSNWNFTALYTNLDWTYVINQENKFGVNLVPKNYSDSWKNTTPRTI